MDGQVKLSGYRIELAEVENALNAHPDILLSAVIKKTDNRAEPYLKAFLAPSSGREISIPDVSRHLAKKLPFYMMPSDFQLLDSIPLTPSRKIDRDALSRLPDRKLVSREEIRKPDSELEFKTASFFREVLEIEEEISVESNFFALGGNSLQAMRIVNRLRKEFGVNLPLASIFNNPTVEELSMEIMKNLQNG